MTSVDDQRTIDLLCGKVLDTLTKEFSEVRSASLPPPLLALPARQQLRALLTIRPPETALPADTLNDIDRVLQHETKQKHITSASDLPTIAVPAATASAKPLTRHLSKVSLWRGDITTLAVDAVVNAANSALLGCFQPTHRCIDNVIHDAAGPRLRAACFELMEQQGDDEPVGRCKVTPAFNLPSKYVLHTVGPNLQHGARKPSARQASQLKSCYLSCLDASEASGVITSVAFCCISTGLFGYPAADATRTAVLAVLEWLDAHPNSHVQHVIFDVFTEADLHHYQQVIAAALDPKSEFGTPEPEAPVVTKSQVEGAVESKTDGTIPAHIQAALLESQDIVTSTELPVYAPNSLPLPQETRESDLNTALNWIQSADSILLCGAAGLSAACGLDYTSEEICARLFPAMAQHDFHCFYQAIGKHDWEPRLQWGYLFQHLFLSRFSWPKSQIYQELLQLSKLQHLQLPTFVYTSNADGMFEQNGFDPKRIYTIQGDYSRIQCLEPCADDSYWPIRPYIDAALPHIDPATQLLDPAFVPHCPRCNGPMMMNVRGGDWFLEEQPHAETRAAYHQWRSTALQHATKAKPLVILEIGAGFNTPGVIRHPMEQLAARHENVRLIRINAQYPQVPGSAKPRAVGLQGDAAEIVHWLYTRLSSA